MSPGRRAGGPVFRALNAQVLAEQAPPWAWALVLAAASPWLRVRWGLATIYPGHLALSGWLAWSLLRHGFFRAAAQAGSLLPLRAAAVGVAYVALASVLRGQWLTAAVALGAGLANLGWGWAAFALGRFGRVPLGFQGGALLFLLAGLVVGTGQWAAQAWWPQGCAALNCDPLTPPPYAFTAGWNSSGQYLIALALLLPLAGEPLLAAWRSRNPSTERWALLAVGAAAGLGLLAGTRWWGLLVVGAGIVLLGQILLLDWQPSDRLLLRGLVFLTLFGAVALYGMVPGYLAGMVYPEGRARALAIVPAGSAVSGSAVGDSGSGGALPTALSSEQEAALPVSVTNSGSYALGATADQPAHIKALLLYTPRAGGETRVSPAGEALLSAPLPPGATARLVVPLRVPPWVSQGYLVWSAEDHGGQPLVVVEEASRGLRFVNVDYTALDKPTENPLTALARRARDFQALTQAPAAVNALRPGGPSITDALETLFFSPIWGQAPRESRSLPVDPRTPLLFQLLGRYGLLGLGLLVWFWLDLFRRSYHLAFGRRAGAGRMAWRLVPACVLLLGMVALFSGALGDYHSLWGCFLLSGFVQGVHARVYPPAPERWRLALPRLGQIFSRARRHPQRTSRR